MLRIKLIGNFGTPLLMIKLLILLETSETHKYKYRKMSHLNHISWHGLVHTAIVTSKERSVSLMVNIVQWITEALMLSAKIFLRKIWESSVYTKCWRLKVQKLNGGNICNMFIECATRRSTRNAPRWVTDKSIKTMVPHKTV